jgi:putative Mn2+ efflux pump MntP
MLEIISAFLLSIGINPSHLVAGIAGGFARMLVQCKRLTWEVFSGSLVGTFCAIYLTPLIGKWVQLDMSDISVNNALAFGIGIIGLSLAEGFERPRLCRRPFGLSYAANAGASSMA